MTKVSASGPIRSPLIRIAMLCVLLSPVAAAVEPNDLWPEDGVFSGPQPDPYYVHVRQALLQDDNYPLCELLVIPSFSTESVVYVVQDKAGKATVISRSLKRQLWGEMSQEIKREAHSNSYSLGSAAQVRALQHVRPIVETHTADLDKEAADLMYDVCKRTLLRVHYPSFVPGGLDGEAYHAGHWIEGEFLSGQTWSPEPGTIARDFIEMEAALKAFADADATRRVAARTELLVKVKKLGARL